jgi:hypothetical protein
MFERERSYPCAVTCSGATEPARAQVAGIQWVTEQQKSVGGQVLLFVPRKGDLSRMNNLISRFAEIEGVAIGTWRSYGRDWPGGPVLAAWPNRVKLAEVADSSRTRALCVIPWADGETTAWQRAARPELLAGAPMASAAPDLHPIVVVGLTNLALDCITQAPRARSPWPYAV